MLLTENCGVWLEAYVAMIAEMWREHGGKGAGSIYSHLKSQHDGPLIRLLLELFEQAEVPKEDRPGRHTLHNAILAAASVSAPTP